jgi:hypothetical protein
MVLPRLCPNCWFAVDDLGNLIVVHYEEEDKTFRDVTVDYTN